MKAFTRVSDRIVYQLASQYVYGKNGKCAFCRRGRTDDQDHLASCLWLHARQWAAHSDRLKGSHAPKGEPLVQEPRLERAPPPRNFLTSHSVGTGIEDA